MKIVAVERPLRMRAGPEVGNSTGVCLRCIADPDPHKAITLDDRIGSCADAFVWPLTAHRHLEGASLTVDEKAVITAADVVSLLDSHGQRKQAVRARVVHRDDGAIEFAIQHDWL